MPIKAVDLRRYYTVGGTTVKALDGVSLDIADGSTSRYAEPAAVGNPR